MLENHSSLQHPNDTPKGLKHQALVLARTMTFELRSICSNSHLFWKLFSRFAMKTEREWHFYKQLDTGRRNGTRANVGLSQSHRAAQKSSFLGPSASAKRSPPPLSTCACVEFAYTCVHLTQLSSYLSNFGLGRNSPLGKVTILGSTAILVFLAPSFLATSPRRGAL